MLRLFRSFKKKKKPVSDLVGYEAIIDFLSRQNILAIDGDFVEIGTFLGGGAKKLSEYIAGSGKLLYVLDIFDPSFDCTRNTEGNAMADLYSINLKQYKGISQREAFDLNTSGCNNIMVTEGDSKTVVIGTQKIAFTFIDGNHDPEYVENDFYLVWDKTVTRGIVAFHDYEWDLPQTTAAIKKIVQKHAADIDSRHHDTANHILYLIKG